jgi:hypothetical protein
MDTGKLTSEKLKEYSKEHILYEIEMLLFTGSFPIPPETNQYLVNIILESFTIHLRNVITFLYPTDSKKPTDVCAYHFFSPPNPGSWENICPVLSQSLENARKRAHKEIGHITTERITGGSDPAKQWDRGELLSEVISILLIFCSNADSTKLDGAVKSACLKHSNGY